MSIVEALKKIVVALGGAESVDALDETTIVAAIEGVAAALEDGSLAVLPSASASDNGKALIVAGGAWTKGIIPAELPTVSADDNGKILKVVNGAWAAASAE